MYLIAAFSTHTSLQVHTECRESLKGDPCSLGIHRHFIVPPTLVKKSDTLRRGLWEVSEKEHMYIYTYVCTYVCTYTRTYYTYVSTYVRTCVQGTYCMYYKYCTYVRMCLSVLAYTYIQNPFVCMHEDTHVHACAHTHTHTRARTYIHTHTHTHTHRYVRTYVHTYTHARART